MRRGRWPWVSAERAGPGSAGASPAWQGTPGLQCGAGAASSWPGAGPRNNPGSRKESPGWRYRERRSALARPRAAPPPARCRAGRVPGGPAPVASPSTCPRHPPGAARPRWQERHRGPTARRTLPRAPSGGAEAWGSRLPVPGASSLSSVGQNRPSFLPPETSPSPRGEGLNSSIRGRLQPHTSDAFCELCRQVGRLFRNSTCGLLRGGGRGGTGHQTPLLVFFPLALQQHLVIAG